MVYGDYIKLPTKDARLKTFIKRIEDYNRSNSSYYIFYTDSLNEVQEKQFGSHLNQPIRVYRDAIPVVGKFPLVIYHAGLGGTLNDNSVLCEYLASHGFVVITGAFQSNDYKSMNLNWDLERSAKDMDFMLNSVKHLPFIDFSRISAIGHSYGAQAVLAYQAEDRSPVSCLIIIDTTMDYTVDASPDGFEKLTRRLYGKIGNINAPMLVFANPEATFRVIDSLQYSNRTYCTIELEHNDFTSLTSLPILEKVVQRSERDSVWSKYAWVADYSLHFLKDNVYHDASARSFVMQKRPSSRIYEVPKGKKLQLSIPEYSDYSTPPSRVQFDYMLLQHKHEILNKVFEIYPRHWSEDYLNNTGYTLLKRDVEAALYVFKKNTEIHPESWNVWDSLGEAYMRKGEKELAIESYRKSMELNPKNENGSQMLQKLTK